MMVAALSVQAQDTYVVAGTEDLLGVNWDGSAEANKMTTSDDGVTYVLTKTGVKLRKNSGYDYKIVKNGSEWIGDSNGNNLTYTPDADGEYTVPSPIRRRNRNRPSRSLTSARLARMRCALSSRPLPHGLTPSIAGPGATLLQRTSPVLTENGLV